MNKRVIAGCVLISAAAIGCIWVIKEYKEMKMMKNDLENHPLYRAEKQAVRLKNRKDEKTVKVSENASLKSKLLACYEILR